MARKSKIRFEWDNTYPGLLLAIRDKGKITYDELLELAMSDAAIAEAELARDGVTYDAREQLAALRRKHLG